MAPSTAPVAAAGSAEARSAVSRFARVCRRRPMFLAALMVLAAHLFIAVTGP